MKKILEVLKRVVQYIIGNIFVCLFYDRKYFKGEWFNSKYGRAMAPGWQWVCNAGVARLFRGSNKDCNFPVSATSSVVGGENIIFHPDDLRNFQGNGNYFQAIGAKITIGRGTWIAPGVGIIASNHDISDVSKRKEGEEIIIGENCWIGMNAVILPGVILGNNTVVGAGAIVTKSFENGHCVIGGNPAKIIKTELKN